MSNNVELLLVLFQLFLSNSNNLIILIWRFSTLFIFLRLVMLTYSFCFILWFKSTLFWSILIHFKKQNSKTWLCLKWILKSRICSSLFLWVTSLMNSFKSKNTSKKTSRFSISSLNVIFKIWDFKKHCHLNFHVLYLILFFCQVNYSLVLNSSLFVNFACLKIDLTFYKI